MSDPKDSFIVSFPHYGQTVVAKVTEVLWEGVQHYTIEIRHKKPFQMEYTPGGTWIGYNTDTVSDELVELIGAGIRSRV